MMHAMHPFSVSPESMAIEGLRLYAAGLRGEVQALDTITPLPAGTPVLLCDTERHLMAGGELHTLKNDELCIGAQVMLQVLEMYPKFAAMVRRTERGQSGYRAVWLMEREVERRVRNAEILAGRLPVASEPVFVAALRCGVQSAGVPELLGVAVGSWHSSLRIDPARQLTGRPSGMDLVDAPEADSSEPD